MSRIIKRGVLNKKTEDGYEKKEYLMKLIGMDYIPEVLDLQDTVVRNLNLSEIFQSDDKEFFKDELEKGGKIIGVFAEKELVAYRFITTPKGESMNLGVDLQLPKKEIHKVGHLETTIVHPDYRGNGLQRKTLVVALDIFKYLEYRHICSTISPKNYHSLKNVMSGGLVIKSLKDKYGGKLRFILHRDLMDSNPRQYKRTIAIDDVNIVRNEKILENGFEGYQTFKNRNSFAIRYGAIM